MQILLHFNNSKIKKRNNGNKLSMITIKKYRIQKNS